MQEPDHAKLEPDEHPNIKDRMDTCTRDLETWGCDKRKITNKGKLGAGTTSGN